MAVIAVAIALAAGWPRDGTALTLADLDAGGSFVANGLTFSDFDVSVAGDLSSDLSDYPVQVLSNGFRLSGPLSAVLGEAGTVLISYVVTAPAAWINGASLLAPGIAIGDGSQAWASDTITGPGGLLASLFAYNIAGVGASPHDMASFSPVEKLEVAKVVDVEAGMFAALPLVDERFSAVPEPLPVGLVTLGLAGLALAGRRRDAAA